MGWLEAVTFVCLIKMFHMFVSHCVCVCVTLAAGASARRMKSLLTPGFGLKE